MEVDCRRLRMLVQLRRQPEQHFALDGFDQVAEPGVADAGPAAVELGGDGRLVVQRRQLASSRRRRGPAPCCLRRRGLRRPARSRRRWPWNVWPGWLDEDEGDILAASARRERVMRRGHLHVLQPPLGQIQLQLPRPVGVGQRQQPLAARHRPLQQQVPDLPGDDLPALRRE